MSTFNQADVVQAFVEWLGTELDLEPCNGVPIGERFYCRAKNKEKRNKDGRAKLFTDNRPAGWAQNWTIDDKPRTWAYGRDEDFSPAEREASRATIEAARREREAEDVKVKEAAAALAAQTLKDDTAPCTAHPYTTRKGVQVHDLRVTTRELRLPCTDGERFLTVPKGALVVPLSDVHGKLWSLQFIFLDGTKRFLPGGRKLFFLLGKLTGKPGEVVLVAEGFATAATLHEATGKPVLVAFDAGNMTPVVEQFQAAHPGVRLGICNDDDWSNPTNAGLEAGKKALVASVNGALVSPPLGLAKETGATDWNDWAQFIGLGWKEQIAMEVNRALAQSRPTETTAEVLPASRCLATVEPRPVKWLWFGRLASGEMVVLTGPPGAGKGLVICYIVACYTTGRPMAGDRQACPAGNVMYVSVEDADDTALVPRLKAAGANLDRVHSWIMDAPPTLPDDTDKIVAELDRVQAGILILDPAPTLLTKEFSSNSDSDVRRAYSALGAACRTRGVALILVRHTNKRQLGDAMARGGGSIGWSGMARIELMLGRRPSTELAADVVEDSAIILAPVKSNLGRWPRSLCARIVEAGNTAKVEFIGESDATADDLVSQDRPRTARKTEGAEALLRRVLGDFEWHLQKEIDREREAEGISYSTLNRVKTELRIECKQRAKNVWEWRLPRQIVMAPGTDNLSIRQCDNASQGDVDNLTSNNSSSLGSSDSQDVRFSHTGTDNLTDGGKTGPSAAGVLGNCTRVRPDSTVTPADVEALQEHLAGLNGTAQATLDKLWTYWKDAPSPTVSDFLSREKGRAHA